jgi:aminoglycoside phosphotransferase (APT) family kinase protein
VVDDELLARLRARVGDDVEFAEPPTRLGGGFYTANFRFSLRHAPDEWISPKILRLFPTHAPEGLDGWEVAVQRFVSERGVPAPTVDLYEPGSTIEGRRWFVMPLLPGAPATGGIKAGELVRGARRMFRDLPRQTAELHLALHRLDPAPLVATQAGWATLDRWWTNIAKSMDGQPSRPLEPGLDWLREHEPVPREPLALCHGDSWGGNILVDHDEVTGLIDWTVATVAEPALDLAFLTSALSLAPVGKPGPMQRVARWGGKRIAAAYRSIYLERSNIDLTSMPYYEALRCLLELTGVVRYRTQMALGQSYDGPRPTWDSIAHQMVDYFEARTGVRLSLPPPVA